MVFLQKVEASNNGRGLVPLVGFRRIPWGVGTRYMRVLNGAVPALFKGISRKILVYRPDASKISNLDDPAATP